METFYWHDYETWGINPAEDKPSQFAGVRTDYDLNIVGEPLNLLCKPSQDTFPAIEACLITGLTPQQALKGGVSEREFFAAVHSELARPQTCGVGYNSLRFDDEVTRYGFYRNFYDPYAREWQSGNSRWDIIDMVRLCYAVRPDGIEWPRRDDGEVTFRLEKLTEANGLSHEAAHDALSDVYATIAMAKLIKTAQPKLYQHVFSLRNKQAAQKALMLGSQQPRLHISSRFGAGFASASLILPVAQHPVNKNEMLCVDLRHSPQPLFDCSAEELAELLYTRIDELPEGIGRIPLKSVHINRSPVVLSPGLIDDAVLEKTKLDLSVCEQHRQQLIAYSGLAEKLRAVASASQYSRPDGDVETQLYGGFFGANDKQSMQQIPQLNGEELAARQFIFEDSRLPELLFRYRARNFPESLNAEEQGEWREYCVEKLLAVGEDGVSRIAAELDKIHGLTSEEGANKPVLTEVEQYLVDLQNTLGSRRQSD